jgi:hypothetical protein
VSASSQGLFSDPRGEQQELPADQQQAGYDQLHPLDVPQDFEQASSYRVRDDLEGLVRADLLGPAGGEHERFPPPAMGPRERYLIGMLGPRHVAHSAAAEASEVPDTDSGVGGEGEAELPEILAPQSLGKLWASSMGLSFAVPAEVAALSVTASWGSYTKQEVEDEDGAKRRTWVRDPVTHTVEVRLDEANPEPRWLTESGVRLSVQSRPRDGRRVVELALINGRSEPEQNKDTAWLFQTRLVVTAPDGDAPVVLPIDDPAEDAAAADDPEEAHLRLLYRTARRYATGRNVAVHAEVAGGEQHAHRLETTWLPVHEVPATEAPGRDETRLAGTMLAMDELADAEPAELARGLAPLAGGYTAWLDEQDASIPELPAALRETARSAVDTAREAAGRVRAGIALLSEQDAPGHADALAAFRFANRAMAEQRRHTTLAERRERQGLSYPDALDEVWAERQTVASWRPFQLAFVLLNLPALTDAAHPERAADPDATVDLLFFPTGGGKTEAYLGLTAYTFAIRRLQGTIGTGVEARSGAAGTAVLMRYTLRLLTAQQFQRAAALVCAAETIRRADTATWGETPFRIGLWVGSGVSPNWFEDAREQIADAREAGTDKHANVLQTLACPWCGTALRGQHDLHTDTETRRVLLYCPHAEGSDACPFSRTRSEEGLPILTVDEEIYRYAPSLVVATVDKLAQLPWRGYAGTLFGRVRARCPRHGYRHDDLDERTGCKASHKKTKGGLPAVASSPEIRLRPPELIIQDELHLISGALGTTVGLFESAVDELCTWRIGEHETGPKIVASTATTKRAREQVRGVFARDLRIFPPQVLDVSDTFFSRQVPLSPETPGRRYIGVCAHGIRLKSAEIRLAEILLLAGQTLLDRHGAPADPYMTLVGYFNATRELAGMRRYLDDDVTTRVRRHGRRKGLADRIVAATGMLAVQELTSRISSGDISEVLRHLEIPFDPELDTSARRRAINQDYAAVAKANRGKSKRNSGRAQPHALAQVLYERAESGGVPFDVVLATSMLQVGVDVSRFGLMVMTGQPKNTAEYIQATSRVGRSGTPGLVVTLYNWARPRDLAHFEDFEHYHSTFYRQVEALSVTPFTRRSLDRSTAGTFVAAVRNVEESYSHNADAPGVELDGDVVRRVVERMLARAMVVEGTRGRDYLAERIGTLTDLWNKEKTAEGPFGYRRDARKQMRGLLHPAGNGRWDELTVAHSMRETENEINLLVPGGDHLFEPVYGAPEWSFGAPSGAAEPSDDDTGGDEMGDSSLHGKGA